MKKPVVITIAVALLVVAAAVVYVLMSPNKSVAPSPNIVTDKVITSGREPTITEEQNNTTFRGSYVNYDQSSFDKRKDGTTLLFFHAPWCPQCRELDTSIRGTTLPDNLTIFKVDYDSNQALRQKYGVTIQTTLVKVDSSGKLVEKYVAYEDPTFESVKKNLLD